MNIAKVRESISRNWDMGLGAAIVGTLAYFIITISPVSGYAFINQFRNDNMDVEVECLSGDCWIRPQGSVNLYPIPPGHSVDARLEDEAITLGEGSQLVIRFREDNAELRLSNTGIIRVAQGRQNVDIESDESSSSDGVLSKAFRLPEASALIYVGEIPLQLVSPNPETPVIASAFPVKLHFAFQAGDKVREEGDKLLVWTLVEVIGEGELQKLSTLKVNFAKGDGGPNTLSYFGDFSVPKAGLYALVPANMEVSEPNIGFVFEVKPPASLENELNKLLDGVESDSQDQIEIRGF